MYIAWLLDAGRMKVVGIDMLASGAAYTIGGFACKLCIKLMNYWLWAKNC
jgi:hypothetical protein